MRKLPFLLLVINALTSVLGQQELKRADAYFDRAFYSDAIPLYEELLPSNKSSKLIKNLADSYYKTYNMKAASRWYAYLVSNYGENVDESYHFKLNQSLKAIGDYEQANAVLLDFYSRRNQIAKVNQLKKEFVYLENVSAIGERFDIKNLNINTTTSEFGAVLVDSNLVYTASRKKSGAIPKLYRWNNQNYLDIYSHAIHKLAMGDSLSVPLSNTINTKMHEGTFAITKDRKTIYFTRNSNKKTNTKKITHLKIYKAEWVDGEWKNDVELPFNGDAFSTEHPALSEDETKLYFASDREGGLGSFDLYFVDIQSDGFYGNPINLGKDINTDKKEQFPFLDQEGNLYFSSNGHPGYGLLDVFISKNENGIFQKPDNLGLPVNSGYDDFSLTLNPSEKQGFFSSNRPGGKGSDDIYSFRENKPLIIEDCQQFIAGTLTDKTTKLPISNGKISLLDTEGKVIKTIMTGQDASFKFLVECSVEYKIEAKKEGYEDNFKVVLTNKERNAIIDGSLTLFSREEREKQKALALQKKREEAEKMALAEAEKKRREERIAEEQRLQLEKEEEEKKKIAEKKAKKEHLQKIEKVIQQEKDIVTEDGRTIIKTEEIHFDYSMWYLRRESRKRLGKVIEIMKSNPGIVLEIGTHTDIRGNSEYNRKLSQKRADSAKEFLVENGIAEKRVIAKGYGESRPIVKCETVESCTEEDHEWNRRCELVIVKWE